MNQSKVENYIYLALSGVHVISQIYSYVNYSNCIYLERVLNSVSHPFFNMLKNWIVYGNLVDLSDEFFVAINPKTKDDGIWFDRYKIIYENIPVFAQKDLYYKAFEIGKCVNFIRNYCELPQFTLLDIKDSLYIEEEIQEQANDVAMDIVKVPEDKKTSMDIDPPEVQPTKNPIDVPISFNKPPSTKIIKKPITKIFSSPSEMASLNNSELSTLKIEIDLAHKVINKHLVGIFFDKFKFLDHLTSLNRYLLLGQGDMMQYLMDLLVNELKKPASQIQKHNLKSILETAIGASNAQYHKLKDRLDIRLLESSVGDTGWDIFVLEYNIETPLNVIFNSQVLKEYQKLFFFFWKLKRLEFTNDHQTWRNFMTQSHVLGVRFEGLKPFIHRAMLFNQQIIFLVSTLHNYITLEVLETQYKKLLVKFEKVENLNELAQIHNDFVQMVIEQSLLNDENLVVYNDIMKIFDVILRFKTALDVLVTTLLEEFYSKFNKIDDGEGYESEGGMQPQIGKFSKEAFSQISLLFNEYKEQVGNLIKTLDIVGKGNFRFLAMKLDYNYYYSELDAYKYYKSNDRPDDGEDQPRNIQSDGEEEARDEHEEMEGEDIGDKHYSRDDIEMTKNARNIDEPSFGNDKIYVEDIHIAEDQKLMTSENVIKGVDIPSITVRNKERNLRNYDFSNVQGDHQSNEVPQNVMTRKRAKDSKKYTGKIVYDDDDKK